MHLHPGYLKVIRRQFVRWTNGCLLQPCNPLQPRIICRKRRFLYPGTFEHEIDIESAKPDFEELKKLDLRGIAITAKSARYDFVARFFAPRYGIPEDPVTGSAYTFQFPVLMRSNEHFQHYICNYSVFFFLRATISPSFEFTSGNIQKIVFH